MNIVNEEYFKYIVVGADGSFVKRLHGVEGAAVRYGSLTQLKQEATINIVDEEVSLNDRVQIWHVLNGSENLIGTFMISRPENINNGIIITGQLKCFSMLLLLKMNKCERRYYVPKGTNVVAEVTRIATSCGLKINIAPSNSVTSTNREFEIGTPYIDVCNDLLDVANYTTLYPLPNGTISAKSYVLPNDRTIDFVYDESDQNNIVLPHTTSELDLVDVPNVFVRYVNNPDTPTLAATYENNNPQSPTSTANRPRNVSVEMVQDAVSIQALHDMAKRDCANATNKYFKVTVKTAINPAHGYSNCVYVKLGNIVDKFIETEWAFDCITGAEMTHKLRKVVYI